MSQSEVAARLNLRNATVSGYERNVTTPSLEILKKLALLYNTTSDFILGLTDREEIFLDDFTVEGKSAAINIINNIRDAITAERNKQEKG